MNSERLLSFADFLDNLNEEVFDFENIVYFKEPTEDSNIDELPAIMAETVACDFHNCGACACAIGWLPAFEKEFYWKEASVIYKGARNFDAAAEYFDVDRVYVERLFNWNSEFYPGLSWTTVKPKHVATAIRRFVTSVQLGLTV